MPPAGGRTSATTRGRFLHALLAEGAALSPPPAAEGEAQRRPLSRTALWELSGLSPATGRKARRELIRAGLVEDDLRLGRKLGMVLALSLGTESARGALVDANGAVLHPHSCPPRSQQLVRLTRDQLLDRLATLAHGVLEAGLGEWRNIPLIGVAVAWPTPLDAETKVPSPAVLRHRSWAAKPESVEDLVTNRLALTDWAGPTIRWGRQRSHAINDANAVALSVGFDHVRERAIDPGDKRGGAELTLRLGGGVGAGLLMRARHTDGRSSFLTSHLVEGFGYTGEIAHLPLSRPDVAELGFAVGKLSKLEPAQGCACGREICLDSVTSARALVHRIRSARLLSRELQGVDRDTDALRIVLDHSYSPSVQTALEQAGQLMGRALAGPVMLLNPRSITLSGALVHPALVEGFQARTGDWLNLHDAREPRVEPLVGARNGFAPVRGAALAALRGQLFRSFDSYKSLAGIPRPYTSQHLATLRRMITPSAADQPLPQQAIDF